MRTHTAHVALKELKAVTVDGMEVSFPGGSMLKITTSYPDPFEDAGKLTLTTQQTIEVEIAVYPEDRTGVLLHVVDPTPDRDRRKH